MTDNHTSPESPRRFWLLASTPTPDTVTAVRRYVGESFRDGDAVLLCDGVCLSGNLQSMPLDLVEVARDSVEAL